MTFRRNAAGKITRTQMDGYTFASKLEAEVWKPVPGFGDKYEVSNRGRVRSWKTCRYRLSEPRVQVPLKTHPELRHPYLMARFYSDGKQKLEQLARVVLTVFVRPPLPGEEAAHLNGISTDNRVENLMWATHKENESHKVAHGTRRKGSQLEWSKLTEDQVREARATHAAGNISIYRLAKRYGVCHNTMTFIVRRRTWKHVD